MKLRVLAWLSALLFVPAVQAVADTPAVPTEPEQFQIKEKTEVPNVTLTPGSYSIRILDHLRDRVILQVSGKNNHVEATFLAVPASTMASAPVGPIAYGAGPKGKAAMKGFAFPGGTAVEFVYPKNDAVSIAQANGTRVMAIDPASEGRVPAPKLNQNDMQMITLWMLEPSRVGPGDAKPTIAASRYQAPQPAPVAAPAPAVETAQAQRSPATPPSPTTTAAAPAEASSALAYTPAVAAAPASHSGVRRQRPAQIAQNDVPSAPTPVRTHTRPAGVTALPHTASMLPWVWLGAFGSLALAVLLSLRRISFGD